LVQAGAAKFYDSGVLMNLSDAVSKLFSVYLVTNLHPSIIEDRDAFRSRAIYTEHVDALVTDDREVVQAVFTVFCAGKKSSKPRMHINSFVSLASKLGIIEPAVSGFEARHARLAFTMSKLRCADDRKNPRVSTTITFTDFVEALCRCAREKKMPTDREIQVARQQTIRSLACVSHVHVRIR
jgi:hypothetical protein